MTNEQKAELKHLVRCLAGFCTHEGPENFLNAIFEKVLEGEHPAALVAEAQTWVLEWEQETNED